MSGAVTGTLEPDVPDEMASTPAEVAPRDSEAVETDSDDTEIIEADGPDEVSALTEVDDELEDLTATAAFVIVPAVVDDAAEVAVVAEEVAQAPAPKRRLVTLPRHRRPRVRRVTRVIRSVDPWTVFKLALVVNAVLYAATLLSLVLLWNVAMATGTVDNVERFLESFGWDSFEFRGGELYHAAWIIGLFAVVLLTGLWVLAAVVFNLVTDLVGGIRVTVLEEEVVVHQDPSPRG